MTGGVAWARGGCFARCFTAELLLQLLDMHTLRREYYTRTGATSFFSPEDKGSFSIHNTGFLANAMSCKLGLIE